MYLDRHDPAAGQLGVQVQRTRAGRLAVRHGPEELELEPVGVFGVERQARAVIGLADQRACRDEPLASARQVHQVADLPRRVVHPGDALVGTTDAGVLEQAEVMIVGCVGDLEERRLRIPALNLEAQHVDVEVSAALDVGDVEDEVLQAPEAEAVHVAAIFAVAASRHAERASNPGRLRQIASVSAKIVSTGASISKGAAKGCGVCHGVSTNSSTRLPSGSAK